MIDQKPPTDLARAAGTTEPARPAAPDETHRGARLTEVPTNQVPDRPGVTRDGAVLKDAPGAGQPAVPPA